MLLSGDAPDARLGYETTRDDGHTPGRIRKLALVAAVYLAAGAALFVVFLRLAYAVGVGSDMANVILMARDMVHGNVLLHGWHASDVSFYTTELPQYAILESFIGVREEVTHVAATMSYTLAVLFAVLLARGGVSGRRALIRTLIAAGIMLPGRGNGSPLLSTVGHLGTSVPLLLIWVLIDRAGRRRWVPPAVCLLLAWVLVADRLVLVIAVGPLAIVGVMSVVRGLARREVRWFELALAVAAGVAVGLADAAEWVLRTLGGYVLHPLGMGLLPLNQMRGGVATALRQACGLFAAGYWHAHGAVLAFTLLHLVTIALFAVAVVIAVVSLVTSRLDGRVTLVDQVLVVACVAVVCAYGLTTASSAGAHEMAPLVPFGAALTARVLVGRAGAGRALVGRAGAGERHLAGVSRRYAGLAGLVAGSLVLAGYASGLAYAAAQPAAQPPFAPLASWLYSHHLTDGLADYPNASIVTLDSGGRVAVRALLPATLAPYWWMVKDTWYDPASARANFLIINSKPGYTSFWSQQQIVAQFGQPSHVYHTEGTITVLVWNHNLLKDLSS